MANRAASPEGAGFAAGFAADTSFRAEKSCSSGLATAPAGVAAATFGSDVWPAAGGAVGFVSDVGSLGSDTLATGSFGEDVGSFDSLGSDAGAAGTFASDTGTFASDTGTFASETGTFASETGTFASETGTFASETGCFASETGCFASETGCFASETGTRGSEIGSFGSLSGRRGSLPSDGGRRAGGSRGSPDLPGASSLMSEYEGRGGRVARDGGNGGGTVGIAGVFFCAPSSLAPAGLSSRIASAAISSLDGGPVSMSVPRRGVSSASARSAADLMAPDEAEEDGIGVFDDEGVGSEGVSAAASLFLAVTASTGAGRGAISRGG